MRQVQQDLDAVSHYDSDGGGGTGVVGAFVAAVQPHGVVDFKNNFAGQAPSNFLGDAGNFAYYAIGSGFLPDWVLDLGAGGYGVSSAVFGSRPFRDLTGRDLSDSSADRMRDPALASNGCKK